MTIPIQQTIPELEDVKDYRYQETVFVFGDLIRYVQDLERYFRNSLQRCDSSVKYHKKTLDSLTDEIERYKKNKNIFFWHSNYQFPFKVNEKSSIQALQFLEQKKSFIGDLFKAQKLNHDRLMNILFDGKGLNHLDLTNYEHKDHVIRIKYLSNEQSIRMRVFFDYSSEDYRNLTDGFAQYANSIQGVFAKCVREKDINEEIPPLNSIASSGRFRRSTLRIKDPVFDINKEKGKIAYSCQLSDAELEMLSLLFDSMRMPEWLCYDSNTWSSYQAGKIMRNLFGILAIEDGGSYGKICYNWVFIDKRNDKAVQRATTNGNIFKKTINKESLPVLKTIHDRSMELKQKYGKNFYPRFTVKEVSDRTGLKKGEVKSHLDNLVGVLAPIYEPYTFGDGYDHFYHGSVEKFFIPKSRTNLVERILDK